MSGACKPHETRYIAFISYAREDEGFAKQLETEIEAHQRPGSAVSARIFRDRADLTGSAYEAAVDNHLRQSKSLIVLCSPNSRSSGPVGDEIRLFARHHGSERIFPVLVSGLADNEADDQKAFPPALLEVMQGRGMPLGAEYRGLDLQRERVSAGRFEGEWYKLLANIYDVPPADIQAEDTKRQVRLQRRAMIRLGALSLLFLGMTLFSGSLWLRARSAEKEAEALRVHAETELNRNVQAQGQAEPATGVPAAGEPAAVAPPPPAPGEQPAARVYIQVRDEQQLAVAKRLTPIITEELQRTGMRVTVPPIQRLDVGPTKASELRFFRDVEKPDAERIAKVLRAHGVKDLVVTKVPGYEQSNKVRPRQFELWLKPGAVAP